jgi:hypothetical protein
VLLADVVEVVGDDRLAAARLAVVRAGVRDRGVVVS